MTNEKHRATRTGQRHSIPHDLKPSRGARRTRQAAIAAAVTLAAALGFWYFVRDRRVAPITPGSAAGSNVLLITIDTLRADRVGAYGNSSGLTPVLDRLASSGLRFAAAYTPVPLTLPAHASILTGLEPFSHGIRNNTSFRLGQTPTLATMLKSAGYRTGAFVGAFVLNSRFGLNRGFDTYDDRVGHGDLRELRVAERNAEQVIAPATRWILEAERGEPWFAWIHLYDPHAPYRAPAEYAQARSPYDAEVAYTDAMIGRGLDTLRAAGRLDRTIVIVVADHGESLGEHGEATHGLFAYDATLHVPMILNAPGVPAGVVTTPVATVDLVPTVLELLGIAVPGGLDGRSLRAPESGGASRALYFEALDANLTRGWAPLTGTMAGGWKFIDLPIPELYDLAHDRSEARNLATRDAERSRVMQARLKDVVSSRAAAPEAGRAVMDAETTARLASLGYVGSSDAPVKRSFSAADDPKNLVGLNEAFYKAINEQADGRSEAALATLRDVLSKRPDFLAARMSAAAIVGARRPADAIALLQSAPDAAASATAQTELGLAYEAAGKLSEAAACLERAARLRDDDLETLSSLGVVYARLRRFDEARRLFRQILDADPHAPEVWSNLGTLELSAGDRPAAARAFRQAVAADPGYGAAWRGLGDALVASDAAAATDAWRRAVAISPTDFETLFNLGLVLSEGPNPPEAASYLQQFIATAPRDRYGPRIARATAIIERLKHR